MFEEKYQVEEVSPTRTFVRNKSFWRYIKKESIALIAEELNAQGRQVTGIITSRNAWNGFDYLLITLPKI